MVTSNLLVQSGEPRKVIGTVNSAEFLLPLAVSITFIAILGFAAFSSITVGLIIGGVIAAPFVVILARRVRPRTLLFTVEAVLIVTSSCSIYRAWRLP